MARARQAMYEAAQVNLFEIAVRSDMSDAKRISPKKLAALVAKISKGFAGLETLALADKVEAINQIRERLAEHSPFKSEPVDYVKWVPSETVHANGWNPNNVAPPEMELLRLSIMADGYTQPIVSNREGDGFEVVDGFHRNRVGKECDDVVQRVKGYLPIVQIRADQTDKPDRMAPQRFGTTEHAANTRSTACRPLSWNCAAATGRMRRSASSWAWTPMRFCAWRRSPA